ncbi:MAG: DUF421 domain-containing protein [Acidobacteriota bacterium]|nr:DUF421 domain-containing protein [Acidobacteriota bacterium]
MDFPLANGVLDSMFHLKAPVLEKIARPVIVYFAIILLLRAFGKRELAQLNPFDLVVLLSVSNTVQNAIIGDDNSVTGGVLGALSLFAINYVVVRFLFRHRELVAALSGSATRLITGGVPDRRAMAKELLTESELLTVIHRQGFDEFDEVENCTLEPGGAFFIKGKEPGPGDKQHDELLSRLAQLQSSVEGLKRQMENRVN